MTRYDAVTVGDKYFPTWLEDQSRCCGSGPVQSVCLVGSVRVLIYSGLHGLYKYLGLLDLGLIRW